MADIPRILIPTRLPEVNYPRSSPGAAAQPFNVLSQTLGQVAKELREQTNPIEVAKMRSEYDVGLENIRNNRPPELEPEQWAEHDAQQEKQLRTEVLAKSQDRTVQTHVQTHMEQKLGQATILVNADALKRRADINRADVDDQLDLLSDQIARTGDSAEREQKKREGLALIESQSVGRHPAFSHKQKVDVRQAFENKIGDRIIDYDARKDPFAFAEKVERGDYAGVANSVQVQRGLDIAEKLQNQRDAREVKADKGRAEAAKRAFWTSAETHTMDEEQLDRAAAWYDFPKETVDRMKRVNLGLREGTPHGEKLVIDALGPINKVEPTLRDVAIAESNLRNIGDKVSTDSAEYRNATNRLRVLKKSLEPGTPENKERQIRSDARRRLGQLMMEYDLRGEPELRGQLLGQIETMPVGSLKGFLAEKEKEWKARQEKGAEQLKGIRGLRSLAK